MKLNDRVRKLAEEGKTPEEIADQIITEKRAEVERQKAKRKK